METISCPEANTLDAVRLAIEQGVAIENERLLCKLDECVMDSARVALAVLLAKAGHERSQEFVGKYAYDATDLTRIDHGRIKLVEGIGLSLSVDVLRAMAFASEHALDSWSPSFESVK